MITFLLTYTDGSSAIVKVRDDSLGEVSMTPAPNNGVSIRLAVATELLAGRLARSPYFESSVAEMISLADELIRLTNPSLNTKRNGTAFQQERT